MARRTLKGIRTGSKILEVYNEGLLVFMFDQSNLSKLKKSEADFEGGFAADESEVDPELRQLAAAGTFLAYELQQDDSVLAEVIVGPKLSTEELTVGRWLAPQSGFLCLPSGKFRLHTANTLPMYQEPEEKPGKVLVPPGDYEVTIYRLDWTELQNSGFISEDTESASWTGPQELIVLTPASNDRPLPTNQSYLRFPQKDLE